MPKPAKQSKKNKTAARRRSKRVTHEIVQSGGAVVSPDTPIVYTPPAGATFQDPGVTGVFKGTVTPCIQYVFNNTKTNFDDTTMTLPSVTARYVRFCMPVEADGGMAINYIAICSDSNGTTRVHGTNLTVGKELFFNNAVYCNYPSGSSYLNLNDGPNGSSRLFDPTMIGSGKMTMVNYYPDYTPLPNGYFEVDLGSDKTINSIRIIGGDPWYRHYQPKIQFRTNAQGTDTMTMGTNATGPFPTTLTAPSGYTASSVIPSTYHNNPVIINGPAVQFSAFARRSALYGSSVPWSVPGLQLWFDGRDPAANGIQPADESTLLSWNDKSSNSICTNLSHGTPTVNSTNGVVFSGTACFTLPDGSMPFGDSSYSVYILMKLLGGAAINGGFSGDDGGNPNFSIRNWSAAKLDICWWNGNDFFVDYDRNQTILLSTFYESGTNMMNGYLNGTNRGPYKTNGPRTQKSRHNSIGCLNNGNVWNVLNYMTGSIAEILVYNINHSAAQRQIIEGYLATKWGVSANLPITHPYHMATSFASVNYRPPFPITINSLIMWYDANDIKGDGTATSNGANITTWNDKSGNGYTLTANTGGAQGGTYNTGIANNKPGVSVIPVFSGGNSTGFTTTASIPLLTNSSIFIVFTPTTSLSIPNANQLNGSLIGQEGASAYLRILFNVYDVFLQFPTLIDTNTGGNLSNLNKMATPPPFLLSYVSSSSGVTITIYANGYNVFRSTTSVNSTSGHPATDTVQFGHLRDGGYLLGAYSEMVVYNTTLSTNDINKMQGYLAGKWGISPYLPTTHPYYNGTYSDTDGLMDGAQVAAATAIKAASAATFQRDSRAQFEGASAATFQGDSRAQFQGDSRAQFQGASTAIFQRDSAATYRTPALATLTTTLRTIPGLTTWFDAADPNNGSAPPANGANMTTWSDKSGNGYNASSIVAIGGQYNTTVCNGQPGVSFGSFMTNRLGVTAGGFKTAMIPKSPYVTVFFVFTPCVTQIALPAAIASPWAHAASAIDHYITRLVWPNNSSMCLDGNTSVGTAKTLTQLNGPGILTLAAMNPPEPMLVTLVTQASGANLTCYANGITNLATANLSSSWSSTPNPTGSAPVILGTDVGGQGTTFLYGALSEVLHYNVTLSPSHVQYIQGYLATKWGLLPHLPTTHPYYNASFANLSSITNIVSGANFRTASSASFQGASSASFQGASSASFQADSRANFQADSRANFQGASSASFQGASSASFQGASTARFQADSRAQFQSESGSTYIRVLMKPYITSLENSMKAIPGLELWLDGADPAATGTAPAAGSAVSTWMDKSGVGNNATGVGSPTYTADGITFNGSSQYFSTNLTSHAPTESAFAVISLKTLDTPSGILGFDTNKGREWWVVHGTMSWASDIAEDLWLGGLLSTGVQTLCAQLYSGGTVTAFLNGTQELSQEGLIEDGSVGSATGGTLIGSYGNGGFLNGTISEIVVFNTVLSVAQRQLVEGYLANKWNIPLPATHPYTGNNLIVSSGANFQGASAASFQGASAAQLIKDSAANFIGDSRANFIGASTANFQADSRANFQGASAAQLIKDSAANFIGDSRANFIGASTANFQADSRANFQGASAAQLVNDSRAQFQADSRANFQRDSRANYQADSAAQLVTDSRAQFIGDSKATYEGASTALYQQASTANYEADSRANYQEASAAQLVNDSRAQFLGDSRANFQADSKAQFQKESAAQNLTDSGARFIGDSRASFNTASGSTATVNILADLLVTPVTKMIPDVQPVLWFDATDPNGDGSSVIEGGFITKWMDKSRGNTATSVGATQPIYTASSGRPAIQFFGTQSLTLSLDATPVTTPFTIFVVASINDWTTNSGGNGRIVSLGSSVNEILAMNTDSNTPAVVGITAPSTTFIAPDTTPTTTVSYIWEASVTPSSVNVVGIVPGGKGDAFQTVSMPSSEYNSLSIGNAVGGTDSQLALDGNISEIIIFNTSLTTDQQHIIEGYLSWKWGLENNLPANHPFAPNAATLSASSARYAGVSAAQYVALTTLSNVGTLIKTPVTALITTKPVMWFDATDPTGTGVAPANNSIVTSWMDKSGKGNHANVSGTTTNLGGVITVGKTPSNIYNASGLNGKPAIQFNGSQYFMGNLQAGSFSGQGHIFIVFSANTAGTNSRILSLGAGTGTTSDVTNTAYAGFVYKTSPTGPNIGFFRNSIPSFSGISSAWSAPFLWEGTITNTTTSVTGLTGGVPQTRQSALIGALAPTSFAIGANTNLGGTDAGVRAAGLASYLNGNISEIIVYNTILVPSDIATIQAYLSWKWGMQMNLPPNNPYYPTTNVQGESAAMYKDASQATYKEVSGATYNKVSGSSYLGASTAKYQGASTAQYEQLSGAKYLQDSAASFQQFSGANFQDASTANFQGASAANFQGASTANFQQLSGANLQKDSAATFQGASAANYEGTSAANYIGDSRANFLQDSRANLQQDSAATFQGASSARYEGASTANYIGDSRANFLQDSRANLQQDSAATFQGASAARYEGASTANYIGDSRANFLQDSRANLQQDSAATFQGASSARYEGASAANYIGDSRANFLQDSRANLQQDSAATFQGASSAMASSAQVFEGVGNDPSSGKFVTAATSDLIQTIDMTKIYKSGYNARYIVVRAPTYMGDGLLNLSQVMVYDSTFSLESPLNVALGKLVYATSNQPKASIITNGTTTPQSAPNVWESATLNPSYEYIEIDLGMPINVYAVTLIGRNDCKVGDLKCPNRMNNIRVEFNLTPSTQGASYFNTQLSASSSVFQSASAAQNIRDSSAQYQEDSAASFQGSQKTSGAQYLSASTSTYQTASTANLQKDSAATFQGASAANYQGASAANFQQLSDTQQINDSAANFQKVSGATYLGASSATASSALVFQGVGNDPSSGRFVTPASPADTTVQDQTIVMASFGLFSGYRARYIVIRAPSFMGDGVLNLSQVLIYDKTFPTINKNNIAINRPVFATSNQQDSSLLTDGSTKVRIAPNVWQSATPDPSSEYVEIDLGSVQNVYGIRLLGRDDCDPSNPLCPSRMRNVRIEMSLTPSARGASYLSDQSAAINLSAATASSANFLGASTAKYEGASAANYAADSRAQLQKDSAAQLQKDSAASFDSASGANFQGASSANYVADSRAQLQKDSGAQFQQDSGSSFLGASSAMASSAQVFQAVGNDPSSGRFVTPASPPDSAIQDQTIIMSALGLRGGYKARYIVIRAPTFMGDGILNLSQVMVYDSTFGTTKKNIAVGKTVFATSNEKVAPILTDGSKDVRIAPDVWQSATPDPTSEYVEIDLGSVQSVYAIRLLGRGDCDPSDPDCPNRMRNVRIEMNLTPSATAAPYFIEQAAAITLSGATASTANFESASTARYEGASSANYVADSRAQFQKDSGAQFQQDSAANSQGASSANFQGASSANFQKDSGAQFQKDSGAQLQQDSAATFQAASSAMASSAQVFQAVGNDPTSGRFVTPASPSDEAIQDQTIIMSALGLKGGYKARYIVIRAPTFMGDGILNLSQVMVYDSTFGTTKKNIAVGKTVFATSNEKVAPILTDGSKDVRIAPDVWQSATPDPSSEYVEIDLGSVQNVYAIRLLGRGDCDPSDPDCPNRMRNVRIEMSLTPSATAAPYFIEQAAALTLSGATASRANFESASTARYEGASSANYTADSRAQFQQDSRAQFQQDSAANFESASTAKFERASSANYVADSRAQFQQDSRAQLQQDSAATFQAASSAMASSAQVFQAVGNDPTSGRFVTPASPSDEAIQDQTIIMSALGLKGGYKARYIVIRAPTFMGDGILNLSQVMVYDSTFGTTKKNIAVGKTVFATSNEKVAPILTDGSKDVRIAPDVWQSATPDPSSEYVEIDLGSVQNVYAIRLLGRGDCDPSDPDCPNRMRNVRIEMSLTPSATAAPYFIEQAAAIALSGAKASSANFESASTARYEGASSANYTADSRAQFQQDSRAQVQQDSAAKFDSASTSRYENASSANFQKVSGAQFQQDSGAQLQQDSGSSFLGASSATASSAQVFQAVGNDPSSGRFVTPASPSDEGVKDQTIVMAPLGIRSGYRARYIVIRAPIFMGDGILNLSQVMVYDKTFPTINKNNIAFGKPVFATSNQEDAPLLTDGSEYIRSTPDVWHSATPDPNSEYLEIDLGSVQSIYGIRLLGRDDCDPDNPDCPDRMRNVRVELSLTPSEAGALYFTTKSASLALSGATASTANFIGASTAQFLDASTAQEVAAQEFNASSALAASSAQAISSYGDDPENGLFVLPTSDIVQEVPVNLYKGRYIRVMPSAFKGDGYLNISQIMVCDQTGVTNVAMGCPVFATSSFSTDPSIVVDGTSTPRAAPNFWESSNNDRSTEFIEVDLGYVQTISAIRLIGRSDCPRRLPLCRERMLQVRIQINSVTSPEAEAAYTLQAETHQASAANASSAQYEAEEAFTASSANASSAEFIAASAADASTAQYLADEAFTTSAADASTAQYAAYKELSESAAYASGAQLNEAIGVDTIKGRFIFPNKTNDQTIMTSGATGRYVRIRPSVNNGDGYIHLSQVAVFDRTGTNIALGKPTYCTSFYPGTSDSSIITDGTLDTRNPPDIWHSMTKNRSSEFVEIDLGCAKSIYFVRVFGRQDCPIVYAGCQERMYEMRLEINMTTTQDALNGFVTSTLTSVPNTRPGAHPLAIGKYILPTNASDQTIVTNGMTGRYVRVRPSTKKGDGYINISQIIVNDMTGVNISKSKNIYATSSAAATQPPSIVVDGSIAPRNFPDLWQSKTNNRNTEFIEIDLGSTHAISSIEILGRADCTFAAWCEDRMAELRVEINDQTTADAAVSYPVDLPDPYPIGPYGSPEDYGGDEPVPESNHIEPESNHIEPESNHIEPEPESEAESATYDPRTIQQMIKQAVQEALHGVQSHDTMPPLEPEPIKAPHIQTVTVNSMNSVVPVTLADTTSHIIITRKDITLPPGYLRKWDRKTRTYVFYDDNGQIVSHPSPPTQRIDMSTVKRPAQGGGKLITIGGKKKPVQKGGFTPLATDIKITTDATVTAPWTKYFDTLKRQYYYTDNSNGNAVWVHPFLPRTPVQGELKYGDAGLPSYWEKYLESSVNTYFYYDPKTGETSWDHPNPPPFPSDDAQSMKAVGVRGPYVMYRDPATNSQYFFNTDTTETFWVLPNA